MKLKNVVRAYFVLWLVFKWPLKASCVHGWGFFEVVRSGVCEAGIDSNKIEFEA